MKTATSSDVLSRGRTVASNKTAQEFGDDAWVVELFPGELADEECVEPRVSAPFLRAWSPDDWPQGTPYATFCGEIERERLVGRRFVGSCCPGCGTLLTLRANFCAMCGERL